MFKKSLFFTKLSLVLFYIILIFTNTSNLYAQKLSQTQLNSIPGFEHYNTDDFSNIEHLGFNNSFYLFTITKNQDNQVKLIMSKADAESSYSNFITTEVNLHNIEIDISKAPSSFKIMEAVGIKVVASNKLLHLLINIYGKSYLLYSSDGLKWHKDKQLFGDDYVDLFDFYGHENTLSLKITDYASASQLQLYSLDAGKHWAEFDGPCEYLDQVLSNKLFCIDKDNNLQTINLDKKHNKKWLRANFPKNAMHSQDGKEVLLDFDYFINFYQADNYLIAIANYHGTSSDTDEYRYYAKALALISYDLGKTWEFLNLDLSFRNMTGEYYMFDSFYKSNNKYHFSIYHSGTVSGGNLNYEVTKTQLDNNTAIDTASYQSINNTKYGGLIPNLNDIYYKNSQPETGFVFYRY